MSSILDIYWHEMRGGLERLPVWFPGTDMKLGDVGTIGESGWVKETTLDRLSIAYAVDVPGEPIDLDYSSHDGAVVSGWVTADSDFIANGIQEGNLGLRVRFSRAGAFVVKATSLSVHRIANMSDVRIGMVEAFENKTWQPGWIAVTEVVRGGPSLTIVGRDAGGEAYVDLGVAAGVPGPPIASAGAGFKLGTQRGLAGQFVGRTAATIMWRGHLVRPPWMPFGKARVEERGTLQSPENSIVPHPRRTAPEVAPLEYLEDIDQSPITTL